MNAIDPSRSGDRPRRHGGSAAAAGPPRSRGRLVVAALAALLLLIGAAWAALALLLPPEKLKGLVQRQLAISLARDARFERATLGLWPPVRLGVVGLALAEPGGFAQGTMFRARALDLDLDLFAVLRGRLAVRRLVLDHPELHLVVRADGSTNLDGLGRAPQAQPPRVQRPLDLSVRELGIRGGRVLVDHLGQGRRVALGVESKIALDLRGGSRVATHGETTLEDLAWGPLAAGRMDQLDRSLAKLRWKIEHRGAFDTQERRLALETLALRFGGTRLALAGLVGDPGPHAVLDLRARGSGVDLGQILEFLGHADARAVSGLRGRGVLDFDLRIRGALGRTFAKGAARPPEVTGALALANGGLEYRGAPASVQDVSFHARFAPDSLTIGDLAARIAGQPLRGRVAVARFADPLVAFAVRGDLELAALEPLLVPKDGAISGHAAVDLAGNGRAKDPGAMAIEGRIQLKDVRVKQPSLPKEIQSLEGAIQFSRTRASVSRLSGKAGASEFALDAQVDRPLALVAKLGPSTPPAPSAIQFQFRAPYLDLADLVPRGGGGLVLPNARGGGRVEIGKLKDDRLEVADLSATLALAPGVLTVSSFSARAYGGLAGGSARLDVSDPARARIETRARLDSARVERLLAAFVPPGEWLAGVLGGTIDLQGDLADLRRSLTAAGLASVLNGTLARAPVFDRLAEFAHVPAFRSLKFRDLRSNFRIVGGRVFTGPLTLHGPQGDWTWNGSTGLDGTLDYAVSVTLPAAAAAAIGARSALAAGALEDDQGRLLMDFRVAGPARAPRVAWDPAAMQARLKGRVSQAIAEQQQKFERTVRDTLAQQARAAADSARAAAERYRQAVADSLRRKGKGLLEGFFRRGAAPDTTPR